MPKTSPHGIGFGVVTAGLHSRESETMPFSPSWLAAGYAALNLSNFRWKISSSEMGAG